MTPSQTIVLLETDFTNKVKISTSSEFSSKTTEEQIAELAKMYKAGQNIQRILNDKKSGLSKEEINQYRGRVLTGFKQVNALIKSISSAVDKETTVVTKTTQMNEAYYNQDKKKTIQADIKTLLDKFKVKGSLSVKHHSTVVLTITSGLIDFASDLNTEKEFHGEKNRWRGYMQSANYHVDSSWKKESTSHDFLTRATKILNSGNHDNSDIQHDYFDVGHYVDISIGNWKKDYEFTGVKTTVSPKNIKPDTFLLMIADKFGELSEHVDDSTKEQFLNAIHKSVTANQYIAIVTLIEEIKHCSDVNSFYTQLSHKFKELANELDEKTMSTVVAIAIQLP